MISIGMSPNLVHAGGLMVTWHSVLSAAAIVLAVYLVGRWGKQAGLRDGIVLSVAWWAIPGGIIGARLLYVVDNWGFYSVHPERIVAVWSGGIAVYGAFAGGALAGAAYAAWKRFPVRQLLDLSAPALALAQAVGRVGDLINGEHFSTPSSLPWAVVYTPPDSPGFGRPPTHPAVGYEMLADLALFGLLFMLRDKLRPTGSLFMLFAALYAAIRLPLSFLRLDGNSSALGLNQQTWASVVVLAVGLGLLIYLRPRLSETARAGFKRLFNERKV